MKRGVDKWFVDGGFGHGKIQTGEEVFIHASVVQGAEVFIFCTDARAEVVGGRARAEGGSIEHGKVWGKEAWQEEKDREKAVRVV